MDKSDQVLDTTEETVEEVTNEETLTEEVEDSQEENNDDIAQLKAQVADLTGKLKRATKPKAQAPQQTAETPITPSQEAPQTDTKLGVLYTRLAAQFDNDEDLDNAVEKAQQIARMEGVSPSEAIKSDYFKLYSEKVEKQRKAEAAQMRSTRGSVQQAKKSFKQRLDDADHEALWKEKMGL